MTTAVCTHRGIRYATAARFEAPVMVPYQPDRQAGDDISKSAPQGQGTLGMLMGIDPASTGEDCLFLNVFAPGDATPASKLPVLVWIHGGAYVTGSASFAWYDGSRLAARGQVVVTINYRLGALGFLGAGNWGTLDQICALEWVRDHIDAFGGDAGNVTIFGESAGGSSVLALMAAPGAEGLFHRVWSMSPSINQLRTLEQAATWEAAFFAAAGVADLDEARALSVDAVLEAQAEVTAMPSPNFEMFGPTAGGDGIVADLFGAVAANPVPLCIGTTRDENRLFVALDPAYAGADTERWVAHVEQVFGEGAPRARAAYEAARPGDAPSALIAAVQTDTTFRRPAQRVAEARAHLGSPTWMYWFTWASPAFGGVLGSAHAFDIPFAFDNVSAPRSEIVLGDGPELVPLATRIADEITSFAASGAASWSAFDTTSRPTMRFAATSELLHDPEPELRMLYL